MNTKQILFASLLGTLLTGCGGEDADTTNPVVESVKFNQVEVVNASVEPEVTMGRAFQCDVTVSDDEALSQMQLNVHSAFDHHSHARRAALGNDTLAYGPVVKDLTGMSGSGSFSIMSATDTNYVAGEYHMEIVVIDQAGNRTEKIVALQLK